MSVSGRAKSPSVSTSRSTSSISDSVDGGIRGKSSSFGSSPGGLKFKFGRQKKSKTDLTEPQSLKAGDSPNLLPQSPTELSPEPADGSKSPENFFNFTSSGEDVWSDDFTSILKRNTLRKLSLINEEKNVAKPLEEGDISVQDIGVAYVEDEVDFVGKGPRFAKPEIGDFPRGRRATSPPSLSDYKQKKINKSTSASVVQESLRPRLKSDAVFLTSPTSSLPVGRHDVHSLEKIVQLEEEIRILKADRWQPPEIRETIDRILLGKPCCLEWYKAHFEKVALLDAAIATNDGNCIMAILLFLRKSVNQPILLGLLNNRPIAVRHYASFLKQLGATTELITLYRRLDENERLANIRLQQCEAEMNPMERYSKIKACHSLFMSSPELKADAKHIEDYARLTHQQRMIEESEGHGGAVVLRPGTVLFRSMVTTLLYCCRFHRDKPDTNTASPVALRREFNIAEKQYFQMYLLALCIDDDWEAIEALVTTKGFMGFSKKKKSPIGFERIVKTIARKSLNPSPKVLTKYLAEVDDLELRLQLATEVGVYDVGLECLKLLKDRERVRGYINQIPVPKQWEYRKKIDALLSNSQIKWK